MRRKSRWTGTVGSSLIRAFRAFYQPFLRLGGVDEREDVFQRDIGLDGDPGLQDIAASRTQVALEAVNLVANRLRSGAGQEVLGAEAAAEGELGAEFALQFDCVEGLGLDGVEYVEAQLDQVGDRRPDVAAGWSMTVFAAHLAAENISARRGRTKRRQASGLMSIELLRAIVVAQAMPSKVKRSKRTAIVSRMYSARARSSWSTKSGSKAT